MTINNSDQAKKYARAIMSVDTSLTDEDEIDLEDDSGIELSDQAGTFLETSQAALIHASFGIGQLIKYLLSTDKKPDQIQSIRILNQLFVVKAANEGRYAFADILIPTRHELAKTIITILASGTPRSPISSTYGAAVLRHMKDHESTTIVDSIALQASANYLRLPEEVQDIFRNHESTIFKFKTIQVGGNRIINFSTEGEIEDILPGGIVVTHKNLEFIQIDAPDDMPENILFRVDIYDNKTTNTFSSATKRLIKISDRKICEWHSNEFKVRDNLQNPEVHIIQIFEMSKDSE